MTTLELPGESLRRRSPVEDIDGVDKDAIFRTSQSPYNSSAEHQLSQSQCSEQKSDGSPGPKTPQKKVPDLSDLPQNVSKSRTRRFHKLFKSPPVSEYPIDTFSCAFKGDILLHGQMFVSHDWICFYSKIRAKGRLIEIPFNRIISITREKLALFIPNAIGIQTADQKYVFGSFISRDSTYKKLVTLWKYSQDATELRTIPLGLTPESSIISRATSGPSSSSDTTEDDLNAEEELDLLLAHSNRSTSLRQAEVEVSRHSEPSSAMMQTPKSCLDTKYVFKSCCAIPLKLHKIPRTNMLLGICSILVFFLLMSAMGLTYKILLLQSKMEVRALWIPQVSTDYRNRAMTNAYWLQTEKHASVIRQLHAVLEANIHLLEEVNVLLSSLHRQPIPDSDNNSNHNK